VLHDSPFPAETLRSVFATDEGTGEVCQQMLEALATTRQVSPLHVSELGAERALGLLLDRLEQSPVVPRGQPRAARALPAACCAQ
jgi:hypothetical protein